MAIDAVFIGLWVLAALVWAGFDWDSVNVLGIQAKRKTKEAAAVNAALVDSPEPPPVPPPERPAVLIEKVTEGAPAVAATVHREASDLQMPTDPWERYFWAIERIRIELIALAGNSGRLPDRRSWNDYLAVDLLPGLEQGRVVTDEIAQAVRIATSLRKYVLISDRDSSVLRQANELAVNALFKLRMIGRNYIRVRWPAVPLYKDRSLSAEYDTHGVVLATVAEDGTTSAITVAPSDERYEKGRFVSWEWDSHRAVLTEAWYKDPTGGEGDAVVQRAFSESTFFAGREYPPEWGLEVNLPQPHAGLGREIP